MIDCKPFFRFVGALCLVVATYAAPLEPQLQTEVLVEGSGEPVRAGQLVRVHYAGWLADSTKFDDSRDRGEPLEFVLGTGQVIVGWDRGILGMKVGEKRKLLVPPAFGYGDKAIGPIPANSTLRFEVELVSAEKGLDPDVFPADFATLAWKPVAPGIEVYDAQRGTGGSAKPGTRLRLHYTGWLLNGSKFDSSKDRGKPLDVLLGTGRLIRGWELGLDGLQRGGVRWLRIQPSQGYGSAAMTQIPPHSVLAFKVEALEVDADEAAAQALDLFPDLTGVAWKEGPEGLRYSITQTGQGAPAQVGGKVQVHYTGWVLDGTKFDSSRDRGEPFVFPLGAGRVIRGWDLGVEGMLPGEKRLLYIPPGLGYGSRGAGPIPPDATLVFAVELLAAQ